MIDVVASTVAVDPWRAFLESGMLGPERLIRNADVTISRIRLGDEIVPLVRNASGRADCSWVTSLRNAYGPYARAETDIVKMNRALQPLYLVGSYIAETILASGGLAGGNFINNWNLATNLYRSTLRAEDVIATAETIAERDPRLPVVLRSLTAPLHGGLIAKLLDAGFILLPSRQVWIVHNPASGRWRTHRDARRDLALAVETSAKWDWVRAEQFTGADFARTVRLYGQLYRERYPKYNPDYTETFFRIGVKTGFLDLVGLRAKGAKELSGLVGMAHRENVSCTPVLGYDTRAPVELGLYRLLMLQAFQECERRKTMLHCSAGAGLFKFNRGAESHVEFAAIWAKHLPFYRRAQLSALGHVVKKLVVPYLEMHRL
jgi:hypothetical protein